MLAWKSSTSIIKTLLWSAAGVLFAYVTFYLPVRDTRGDTTTIKQSLEFLANIHAQVLIAWGTTAAATIYGLNERRLRHSERQERDARIRKLEKQIDPNVTSSGLTASGTQSKDDE